MHRVVEFHLSEDRKWWRVKCEHGHWSARRTRIRADGYMQRAPYRVRCANDDGGSMTQRKKNGHRVQQVHDRLKRYREELTKLHEQIAHWGHEVDDGLRAATGAIGAAVAMLAAWPKDIQPKRKPPVRRYARIKVGDMVKVADRYRKRTPEMVRGVALTVTAIDGDIISGKYGAVVFGLERRYLEPVA